MLTFGEAVEALNSGKRVRRLGWNGKNLFVFAQVPTTIPAEVIPNMTSLPQEVKDELVSRNLPLNYSNQLAIVNGENQINGWAPSVSDALAKDWFILDKGE
jgi:hypothetical protein